tara:strand:+ start:1389 stop:1730 length:342 start_codon:yes stop_codon:yes gene_type:complete
MGTKIVYNKSNGLEVLSHEDQVTEGLFHLPAGSTEVKPPLITNKQTCKFIDNKWVITDIPEPDPPPEPHVETYVDKRQKEYGSAEDQLEFITEKGLDAWQTKVSEIKKKYPKE